MIRVLALLGAAALWFWHRGSNGHGKGQKTMWTGRTLLSVILLVVAVIAFLVVGFNWTPKEWTIQLAWLGMACFAAAFLPGYWVKP